MSTVVEQSWKPGTLSEEQLVQVAELHLAAFDAKGRTVAEYIEQRLRSRWQHGNGAANADANNAVLHVILGDGKLIAKAVTFGRTIETERGTRTIMGLAAVAAHPEAQGGGWGKKIVRAAFERVDEGEFETSLFQTGQARKFYERLGCRVVNNEFVNSQSANPNISPWNDDFVMIYPGGAAWPTGKIDLMGPGY